MNNIEHYTFKDFFHEEGTIHSQKIGFVLFSTCSIFVECTLNSYEMTMH